MQMVQLFVQCMTFVLLLVLAAETSMYMPYQVALLDLREAWSIFEW